MVVDPHRLAAAASRLASGARRGGRTALTVLAALLEDKEVVDVVVQGRFRGEPAVAALTGSRVVVVNDRQWKPEVATYDITPGLQVQGWQDERSASLTFVDGDRHDVVERIGDRALAVELAQRLRERVSGGAA
jgi:hypothetical protein